MSALKVEVDSRDDVELLKEILDKKSSKEREKERYCSVCGEELTELIPWGTPSSGGFTSPYGTHYETYDIICPRCGFNNMIGIK